MMDPLGTVLSSLTLVDAVLGSFDLGRPWGFDVPPLSADHFFVFAIKAGGCGLAVAGHAPVWLEPGDIAMVLGAAHAFYSDPQDPRAAFPTFWAERGLPLLGENVERQGPVHLTWQTDAPVVDRFTSMGLIVRDAPRNPVLRVLPPLMVIRQGDGGDALQWLHAVLAFVEQQRNAITPGYDAIARQLAYLVFLSLIRAHALQAGVQQAAAHASWLRGLADRHIGTVLAAMHARMAEPWTVASLARLAGMSRSAFSRRFALLVGETPMAHLHTLRMACAAEQLIAGKAVSATAAQVGYLSQWAFRHAFQQRFGCTPLRFGQAQRQRR